MPRALLLLAFVVSACSFSGSDSESSGVRASESVGTVVNQTSASLFVLAVDGETATLIDIAPTISITEERQGEVIAPRAEAPLDVEAYDPGDDVVVFVYRVEGDVAQFATTIQVDGATFARNRGVVTVRRL